MMDTMEWPDDIEAAFDMRRANYFVDCITNGIRVEIPQRNVREVVVVQISDRVLRNMPYPRASGVRCVVARRLREFLNQSEARGERTVATEVSQRVTDLMERAAQAFTMPPPVNWFPGIGVGEPSTAPIPSLPQLLSRFESLEEMAMLDAVTIDPPEVDRFDHDL